MQRYNPRWALAIAALLALHGGAPALLHGQSVAPPPKVVASIKPVHSLVAGVMEGVAVPGLLLSGAASPHAYSMRPSEARLLGEARLVFWIGPALEAFLVKPLATLGRGAQAVTLADAPGIELLAAREGGAWGEHASEAHGSSKAHTEHDEENLHIWLAPANAQALVRAIVAALAEADPPRAERYRANGERLHQRIAALDATLRRRLAPVAERPFIVFHDAYAYLERAYGLRGVGSITVSPERQSGARRISELREKVRTLGAVCVFSEPQFEPRLVQTLIEGTAARTGVLDPEGASHPAGPELYFALMEGLGDALVGCLTPR